MSGFLPGGWKGAVGIAVIALIAVAIANRVAPVRSIVQGS